MNKFKVKYNIKKYKQYKKVRAIDLIIIEKELQKIWKVVDLYTNENVYSINKFILL